MNLSFIGEASEQFSTTLTSDNKEDSQYYSVSNRKNALKEQVNLNISQQNIKNQSNPRMCLKMQRQLQMKDIKISQLMAQLSRLQTDLKKVTNDNKLMASQYEEAKTQLQKIESQSFVREKKQKANQQRLVLSSKQSIQMLKDQLKRLQAENNNLTNSLGALSKQYKVSVRRLKESIQETKKQLEGKLLVREMQQKKVEEMFKEKKVEFAQILQEKDAEFNGLRAENIQLKKSTVQMKEQLTKLKNISDLTIDSLQKQLALRQQSIDLDKKQIETKNQQLISQLKKFGQDMQLQSSENCIKNIFEQYKEQIRRQIQAKINEVQTLKNNLKSQKCIENDLKSKLSLLQEQNTFIKFNQSQNEDFASIIKSHLQNTIVASQKPALDKEISAKKDNSSLFQHPANEKNNASENIISKDKVSHNENFMNLMDCKLKVDEYLRRKQSDPRLKIIQEASLFPKPLFQQFQRSPLLGHSHSNFHRKSMSNLQFIPKISGAKSSKNLLKDQISKKKQALVYLMHKSSKIEPSNVQLSIKRDLFQYLDPHPQKKRSSSMINLVTDKCKQKLE